MTTTYIILNALFAVSIIGGLAAVCRAAHHIAGGRFETGRLPFILVESDEQERLAA
jgi:hypothetical protein